MTGCTVTATPEYSDTCTLTSASYTVTTSYHFYPVRSTSFSPLPSFPLRRDPKQRIPFYRPLFEHAHRRPQQSPVHPKPQVPRQRWRPLMATRMRVDRTKL